MNSGQLVYCLLDADAGWTPEGYRSLAKATVGEYDLGLWSGVKHVDGKPTQFNELSLNRRGLNFDPDSQKTRYPGGAHALGSRTDLLKVVADWLKQFGPIYVGSEMPRKLEFYHRLFKRYLTRLNVSAPFPPFDESEGEPDYFLVGPPQQETLESLLESLDPLDGIDPRRYIDELPSYEALLQQRGKKEIDELRNKGLLRADNYCEYAESVAQRIVDEWQQPSQAEVEADLGLGGRTFRKLCNYLVWYAGKPFN